MLEKKGKDDSISVAKGLAILLMVLAHAGFPEYGNHLIYMFHMPLFFFISGYLFKDSYLYDLKTFTFQRIKKIYIPFVKYGILFLFLHNFFYNINIYNNHYGFLGSVSYIYEVKDYCSKLFKIILTMNDAEQLLGGYWFLHTMFFASFIFFYVVKFASFIFARLKQNNERSYVINLYVGGGILLCLSVSVFFLKKGVPYLGVGAWEFFASFFMMVGYLYRKSLNAIVNTYTKWILLICLLLLLLGNEFWQSGMTDPQWYNVIPYSLSALSGSILTVILSRFFVNHYRHSVAYSFFVYMGNHTLVILTWHFLCFKIVNLLIIKLNFLQIEHLAEFPVIQPYASAGWWVAYVLVGVLIPLVCTYGSTKIKCQINE